MDPIQAKNTTQKSQRPVWQETLTAINTLLLPVQESVVIIRSNPSFDTITAALALSYGLKKIGRKVHIVSPEPINFQAIMAEAGSKGKQADISVSADQIISFLPQKQLRIVIDYVTGSFSKAGMKKENTGLLLNLAPEANQAVIEPLNVGIQTLDSKPEVAFLLETENLFHLGNFYTSNQSFFEKTPLVNVDYHANNTLYGKANLIDPKASSLSEIVTLMLYDLRFVFDKEMAKMLYFGIESKTQNFQPGFFSANMLEATSICLRYQQAVPPGMPQQPKVG